MEFSLDIDKPANPTAPILIQPSSYIFSSAFPLQHIILFSLFLPTENIFTSDNFLPTSVTDYFFMNSISAGYFH